MRQDINGVLVVVVVVELVVREVILRYYAHVCACVRARGGGGR